jgi:hypothetical protein
VHSNLKPSKLVIGKEGEEDKLFLVGFENSEKINHENKSNKSSVKIKRNREYESVFSALSAHSGDSIVY